MWNLNGKNSFTSGRSFKTDTSGVLADFNWFTQSASIRLTLQMASNGFSTWNYFEGKNGSLDLKCHWIFFLANRPPCHSFFFFDQNPINCLFDEWNVIKIHFLKRLLCYLVHKEKKIHIESEIHHLPFKTKTINYEFQILIFFCMKFMRNFIGPYFVKDF